MITYWVNFNLIKIVIIYNRNVCVWHQLETAAKIVLWSTWRIIMHIKQVNKIWFKGIKEISTWQESLPLGSTLGKLWQPTLFPSSYNTYKDHFFLPQIYWSVFLEAASTHNNYWIFLRAKKRFWLNYQNMT